MAERRKTRRRTGHRETLLLGTALCAAWAGSALAQPAPNARPQGGTVVAGTASISRSAGNTLINQGSSRTVIDWSGFDVGRTQSVTFVQPAATATVLNRVNSPEPSQIAGRITANGQVIIQNRAGITFAEGAQVDAHALVATAAGMSAERFMAGSTAFDIPARPGAAVVNRGRITVAQTGLAALVAPNVTNSGVIEAKLGRVVLAGATTHTLDLYGDGLLAIDIGTDGKVVNTGTIRAAGGRVLLTAAAADGIVSTLVEAGGHISADGAAGQPGSVRIQATGGAIIIDGRLSAAGLAAGSAGGIIEVKASGATTLRDTARLNADGRIGGGSIAIGSATTESVDIRPGAAITANATEAGNGGRVSVLSRSRTAMAGRIAARGGPRGGAGGQVEVSGHHGFSLTGSIDVAAAAGPAGTILLDPQDLTIITGGTDNALFQPSGTADGQVGVGDNGGAPTPIAAAIDPGVFANLTGNVVLQAARDLAVLSPVDAHAASLTLQAGRNLTVVAPLTLAGTGTIALQAAVTGFAAVPGYDPGGPLGVLAIAAAGSVAAPDGTVLLSGGAGGIRIDGAVQAATLAANAPGGLVAVNGSAAAATATLSGGRIAVAGRLAGADLVLSTAGGATIDLPGQVAASGTLSLNAGSAITASGSIAAGLLTGSAVTTSITGPANAIARIGDFLSLLRFDLATAGDLAVVGALRAGVVPAPGPANVATIGLSAGGTLALGQAGGPAGTVNAGTVALAAAGGIAEPNGFIATNLLTGRGPAPSGPIALTGGNTIAAIGNLRSSGGLEVATSGNLAVTGTVSAATLALATSGRLAIGTTAQAGALDAGTIALSALGTIAAPNGIVVTAALALAGAAVDLPGANQIATLGAIATSGAVRIANAVDLTVTAPISLTGAAATLGLQSDALLAVLPAATLSVQGDIALEANRITLAAPATSLRGAVTLAGGTLAVSADIVAGRIALAGDSLAIAAALNAGAAGTVELAPFTRGATMALGPGLLAPGGSLAAGTLRVGAAGGVTRAGSLAIAGFDATAFGVLALDATGAIVQTGPLRATRLDATAGSVTLLHPANTIATLGTLAAASLRLATAGDLALLQHVAAGTAELKVAGMLSEAGGDILADTLTGTAAAAKLDGANSIAELAGFTTTGSFSLTDQGSLRVTGAVIAGTVAAPDPANTASITLLVPQGDLTLGRPGALAALNAGTISLLAAGTIAQRTGAVTHGLLVANLLTGPGPGQPVASAAAVDLGGTFNQVTAVGDILSRGDLRLSNALGLTVLGVLSAGGTPGASPANTATLALSTGGDLVLGSAPAGSPPASALLNAGTVLLASAGAIRQEGGQIEAGLLAGASPSAVQLGGDNRVVRLGDFAAAGSFALADARDLTVTGTVSAAAAAGLLLQSQTGAITLAGTALLNGGTVALQAAGTIADMPGAAIHADQLTGAAGGAVTLSGANQIAGLGTFSAVDRLVLNDTTSLELRGAVTVDRHTAPASLLDLTVAGDLTLGTSVSIATLRADTVALRAGGAITEPNGVITAGLLTDGGSGRATGVLLAGGNIVGTLGLFTAQGDFRFRNARDLTVAGTISAGGPSAPDSANAATLHLDVGGDLTIGFGGGGRLQAGTVDLHAVDGISQAAGGSIAANLVTGTAGAAGVFLPGDNAVAALGGFTSAGGFLLNSTPGLAVIGGVTGAPGATLTLSTPGTLAIGRTDAPGSLDAGTVALLAGGAITEAPGGAITATLLTGPAPGRIQTRAASVALAGTNTIARLGDFFAADSFALSVHRGITVAGTVAVGATGLTLAPGALSLAVQGPIDVAAGALLSAGTIAMLTAGDISAPAGGVRTFLLLGPSPGLDIPAAASLNLGGANAIAAIGGFAVTGDMTVRTDGNLAVLGGVSAGRAMVLDVAGDVALGNLALAGALQADRLQVHVTGTLFEPNGLIAAGTLTTFGAGGAVGSAMLDGANRIGRLQDFASAGDLLLHTATALDLAGTVGFRGQASIAADGTLGIAGALAGGTGMLALAAGSDLRVAAASTISAGPIVIAAGGGFAQAGGLISAGAAPLAIAAAGDVAIAGSLAAGALSLASTGGSVLASAGAISAATLTGSAAGTVALDGPANTLAAVGDLAAGQGLTLRDTAALTLVGRITAGGTLAIAAPDLMQSAGQVSAGAAAVLTASGALAQAAGATIAAAGALRITAPHGIGFSGTIAGGGAVTLAAAQGGILESGPAARLVAGTLAADARLGVGLDPFAGISGNVVAAVTTLAGHDGIAVLSSAAPVTLLGTATAAGGVGLRSAGDLVLAPGAAATSTAGGVVLAAGRGLTVAAGAVASGTSLDATATTAIAVGGRLRGGRLLLATAPAGSIVLADGAVLETGTAAGAWPAYDSATGGAFISARTLVIAGTARVAGQPGILAPSLRIDLSGSGVFAASGGLSAPTTTVYVDLAGSATLTGRIDVGAFALRYVRGSRGSAELVGTILGVGGQAAAQFGSITPIQNAAFRINSCPIGSVSCFVVTTERIAPANPIRDIDIRPARDTQGEADVLLPNVSARDF